MRWDYDCTVNWVKRKANGAGRVAAISCTLGIPRGWKSLGSRIFKGANNRPKGPTRNWRVTGVHREWGRDCILKQMTVAGLTHVNLTAVGAMAKTELCSSLPLEAIYSMMSLCWPQLKPQQSGTLTVKKPLKSTPGFFFRFWF